MVLPYFVLHCLLCWIYNIKYSYVAVLCCDAVWSGRWVPALGESCHLKRASYLFVATCHRRFICSFKHGDDETMFKVMFSEPSVGDCWLVLMLVKGRWG